MYGWVFGHLYGSSSPPFLAKKPKRFHFCCSAHKFVSIFITLFHCLKCYLASIDWWSYFLHYLLGYPGFPYFLNTVHISVTYDLLNWSCWYNRLLCSIRLCRSVCRRYRRRRRQILVVHCIFYWQLNYSVTDYWWEATTICAKYDRSIRSHFTALGLFFFAMCVCVCEIIRMPCISKQ